MQGSKTSQNDLDCSEVDHRSGNWCKSSLSRKKETERRLEKVHFVVEAEKIAGSPRPDSATKAGLTESSGRREQT